MAFASTLVVNVVRSESPIAIRVSEETTWVTKPLAPDGLPDYRSVLLDRLGRGVEASRNAAASMWRVAGPFGMSETRWRALSRELTGSPSGLEKGLYVPPSSNERPAYDSPRQRALETRPWPRGGFANPRGWLAANRLAIESLYETATRPEYYSPPPDLLVDPSSALSYAELPDIVAMRELISMLLQDAMSRVQEEPGGAARRVGVARTLAQYLGGHFSWLNALDGLRWQSVATRAGLPVLQQLDDAELLRRIAQRRERQSPPSAGVLAGASEVDLLVALDDACRDFSDRPNITHPTSAFLPETREKLRQPWFTGVADPNETLRVLMDELTRVTALSQYERYRERSEAWSRLAEQFARIDYPRVRSDALRSGVAPAVADGRVIGHVYAAGYLPDYDLASAALAEAQALHSMSAIVAALRWHRVTRNAYPETLDRLSPDPLSSLPVDPFSDQPFRYERRGDGFVLWSVGPNGVNDRASDSAGDLVNGAYAPIDWLQERSKPDGPDDVVVSLPVPELDTPAR